MSLPKPNLDDKTFKQLFDEARNLIPIYAPEWTDFNVSDPGITFIELLAWLTEMQLYRLNKITYANKLKFLKLLGIKQTSAKCAKTDVTFSVAGQNPVLIPEGTRLAAKDANTNENIIFETIRNVNLVSAELKKVISQDEQGVRDNTKANELDGHYFSAFGNHALEKSKLYLGFSGSFKRKKIGLMVYLFEDDLIKKGEHGGEEPETLPSAEINWQYLKKGKNGCSWVDLKVKKDETQSFNSSGLILLDTIYTSECYLPSFEDDEHKLKWLKCEIVKKGHEISPRIDSIKLNTVPVIQQETIDEEIHSGNKIVDQSLFLAHKPVITGSQTLTVFNPDKTRKDRLAHSRNWEVWKEVDDLDASGPDDHHYVIDHEYGEISFGDGVNGLNLPMGENNLRISYRFGGNDRGNVKKGTINEIIDIEKVREANEILEDIPQVINELPAVGGSRKETINEALIRARKELKEPYQAVTSKDYEYIAKSTPGLRVQRAKALADNERGIVTVVIVPECNPDDPNPEPVPSEGFIKTVCKHLDKHRLIATQVRVKKPEYTKVSLNAVIRVKGGYDPNILKNNVYDKLDAFLHPLKGGSDGKGWPFGRNVFQSEIYAVLDELDGVDCIKEITVAGMENKYDWKFIQVPENSLVCSGRHNIKILGSKEGCQRRWVS